MHNNLAPHITRLLAANTAHHLHRSRRIVEKRLGSRAIVDGKTLINFCGNDYLDIAGHPAVKEAFTRSAYQHGLGSSGSALISGYSSSHAKLEEAFAAFLQRDRALLFNSGYHANLGVLTTFANKHSAIIADKYCHASLNAGAQLSLARFYRYRHHDLQQAEELLVKNQTRSLLLMTESVFSMQGSISNIPLLGQLAEKYHAMLMVDDAHGIGILGQHGGGITEHFQLTQKDIHCLVTPLGKGIGSYGAIVSGDEQIIEALLQLAGTYRYCTALPPAICEATLAALEIIQTESWRRIQLKSLCEFFIRESLARNIPLASQDLTPIKSILIGSSKHALHMQQRLIENGLLVSCIRPPTVPIKQACLRISLNCMHEEQQIILLLDRLHELLSYQIQQ